MEDNASYLSGLVVLLVPPAGNKVKGSGIPDTGTTYLPPWRAHMEAAVTGGGNKEEGDEKKRKRDNDNNNDNDNNEKALNHETTTTNNTDPTIPNETTTATTIVKSGVDLAPVSTPAVTTKVSKKSFFEMLKAQEAKAPQLGTVHAKGTKNAGDKNSKEDDNKGKWPCFKCTTFNEKYAEHCVKCRALKRMT